MSKAAIALDRYFEQRVEQNVTVVLLSNMADGVWQPVWKIHERVVAGAWG